MSDNVQIMSDDDKINVKSDSDHANNGDGNVDEAACDPRCHSCGGRKKVRLEWKNQHSEWINLALCDGIQPHILCNASQVLGLYQTNVNKDAGDDGSSSDGNRDDDGDIKGNVNETLTSEELISPSINGSLINRLIRLQVKYSLIMHETSYAIVLFMFQNVQKASGEFWTEVVMTIPGGEDFLWRLMDNKFPLYYGFRAHATEISKTSLAAFTSLKLRIDLHDIFYQQVLARTPRSVLN